MAPRYEEDVEVDYKPEVDTETKTVENSSNEEEEEQHLFRFMKGIREDLAVRGPLYLDDWSRPKNIFTVINATIFAFVIQLIPALIFAELMDRQTEGNLATAEVLLSSGIMGIIYAIFAGQYVPIYSLLLFQLSQ